MKKEVTPIAMRCSKEQFELIKPKLRESNIKFEQCYDFKNRPYLTSPREKNDWISNYKNVITERKIYNQWDEKIFLEACGIEVEPEYKITKEQIIKYDLKELFPEVFEVEKIELEVGKWYFVVRHPKCFDKKSALVFYKDEELFCGFDHAGYYTEKYGNPKKDGYEITLATKEEVFKALKNEVIKRYKIGDYFKCIGSGRIRMFDNNEIVYTDVLHNGIYLEGSTNAEWLMMSGKWAEIVQIITKEEAEKYIYEKLGKKIV